MICPNPRRALPLALAGVLLTAGCYQGASGTVSNQLPTGNGTDFTVPASQGPIKVQNTTIVAGEGGQAALSFTVINNGEAEDALLSVATNPAAGSGQSGPVVVKPGAAVQVGGPTGVAIPLSNLTVPAGTYASVVMTFRNAGVSAPQQVLVVPAVGYYASYGPTPTPTPTTAAEKVKDKAKDKAKK